MKSSHDLDFCLYPHPGEDLKKKRPQHESRPRRSAHPKSETKLFKHNREAGALSGERGFYANPAKIVSQDA